MYSKIIYYIPEVGPKICLFVLIGNIFLGKNCLLNFLDYRIKISTSNYMLGRTIWDKLPKCTFEKFEIARIKQGQFQFFQKPQG